MKTPDLAISNGAAEARQVFSDLLTERLKAKGLSRGEVVQLTKITPTFVECLISGNFDELPGEVFGRGFVKNICKILGPGNEDLLTWFQKGWGRDSKIELQPSVLQTGTSKKMGGSLSRTRFTRVSLMKKPPAIIALAISAALLVSLTIAYLAGPSRPNSAVDSQAENAVNDEDPADVTSEAEAVIVKVEKPVEGSPVQKVTAPVGIVAAEGDSSIKAGDANKAAVSDADSQKLAKDGAPPDAKDKLEIEVLETVKIRKKIDSEIATVSELIPQAYSFTVEDRAELLIYDAAAVRIKFGGRDLGVLGAKGRVRKLVFISEKQDKKLQ